MDSLIHVLNFNQQEGLNIKTKLDYA
jgi:hypothetical protein